MPPAPPPPRQPLGSILSQLSPDIGAEVVSRARSGALQGASREDIQHERDLLSIVQQRLHTQQMLLDLNGRLTNQQNQQYNIALQQARQLDTNLRTQQRLTNLSTISPQSTMQQNIRAYERSTGTQAPIALRGYAAAGQFTQDILTHPAQTASNIIRAGGMAAGRAIGAVGGESARELGGIIGQGAAIPIAGVAFAGISGVLAEMSNAVRHMTEVETLYRRGGEYGTGATSVQQLYGLRNVGLSTEYGPMLGYSRDQSMQMAALLASGGMRPGNQLTGQRMYSAMEFSRYMGVDIGTTGNFLAGMNRIGVGAGQDTGALLNQLASMIRTGGMGGRENEVIDSLQKLTQTFAAQGVMPNVPRLGAMQTILNAGTNPLLQGAYGANALQNLSQGIQSATGYSQSLLYNMARRQNPNLTPVQAVYEAAKGINSEYAPGYLQQFLEMAGGNLDLAGIYMSRSMPQIPPMQARGLLEAAQTANTQGRRLTSKDIQDQMAALNQPVTAVGLEPGQAAGVLGTGEQIGASLNQISGSFEDMAQGLASDLEPVLKSTIQLFSDMTKTADTMNQALQGGGWGGVVSQLASSIADAIKGIITPSVAHAAPEEQPSDVTKVPAYPPTAVNPGAPAPAPEPPASILPPAAEAPPEPPASILPPVEAPASPVETPEPFIGPPNIPPENPSAIAKLPLSSIHGINQYTATEYAGYEARGAIVPGIPGPLGQTRGDYAHGIDAYTCGPASIASVLRAQGQNVTIGQIAQYAASIGALTSRGITMSYVPDILSHFGGSAVLVQNQDQIKEQLASGHPVLTSISGGMDPQGRQHRFDEGHIVTLTGVTPEGNYRIADTSGWNIPEISPGRLRNEADSYAITSFNGAAISASPVGPPNEAPTSPTEEPDTSTSPATSAEALRAQIVNEARRRYGTEAAVAVDALLQQEGGLAGAVSDTDKNPLGSHGPFQLYGGPQGQLATLARQKGWSVEQAARWVDTHPYESAMWAFDTYMGGALSSGGNASSIVSGVLNAGQNPSVSPRQRAEYTNRVPSSRNYVNQLQDTDLPQGFSINNPMTGQAQAASNQMMALSVSFQPAQIAVTLDGNIIGTGQILPYEDTVATQDTRPFANFGGVAM